MAIVKFRPKYNRVVNLKEEESYDVYVGRPSKYGNPFKIGRDGSRMEVISKYEMWLQLGVDFNCKDATEAKRRRILKDGPKELCGKILGCWCAPDPCHANVLAELFL